MATKTLKSIFCILFGCTWVLLLGLLLALAGCSGGSAAAGEPVAGHLDGNKPVGLFESGISTFASAGGQSAVAQTLTLQPDGIYVGSGLATITTATAGNLSGLTYARQ